MNDSALIGLKPRALEIFSALVSAYLETGQPVGSKMLSERLRLDLSPASIRSNMSSLEQAGLLFSPHISAGRIPPETGLRMFVDGLMEYTSDLKPEDRMSIDEECAARGISVDDLLEKPPVPCRGCHAVPVLCCHLSAMLNYSILNLCRSANSVRWLSSCVLMARSKTD